MTLSGAPILRQAQDDTVAAHHNTSGTHDTVAAHHNTSGTHDTVAARDDTGSFARSEYGTGKPGVA